MAVSFIHKAQGDSTPAMKDLLTVLVKNMGRYYPERSHKTVHASDVTKEDFCPRQFRLMDIHKVKAPDRYISPALKATFDAGRALADLYCNDWIGDRGVGHWSCSRCGTKKWWSPKPPTCPNSSCQSKDSMRYVEVDFYCPDSGISGSIDNFAQLLPTKVITTELKIMKGADFEKLAAPLAEHRIRTALYLELIKTSDSPFKPFIDTSTAKVLYISREFGKKNADVGQILPFKEFDVTPDPEGVAPYLTKGRIVRVHRQSNTIPSEGVCTSYDCKTAKVCPVRAQCFAA